LISSTLDIADADLDSFWRTLQRDGVCSLENVLTQQFIGNALEFVHSLSPCVRYGGLRVEFSISRKEECFSVTSLLHHGLLSSLLEKALGKDFRLLRIGGIMSFPGAEDQPVHRDGQPLFSKVELGARALRAVSRRDGEINLENSDSCNASSSCALPPHAVHVWLPICSNYTEVSGATNFYLGSHRSFGEVFEDLPAEERKMYPKVQPIISPGSALIFDDRVFHYGGANLSTHARTCIFYSFARPFYTDGTREQDRDTTGWTEIE
jgi:ectoine hydroxylase-related dioxygenase (phytanoyl-CoA dioxygenase family)